MAINITRIKTAQQIFDYVTEHLYRQAKPSLGEPEYPGASPNCLYRGLEGRSCAVGCLITDDEYKLFHEGQTIWTMPDLNVPVRLRPHTDLLGALQYVHDRTRTDNEGNFIRSQLYKNLLELALRHNLNTEYLERISVI